MTEMLETLINDRWPLLLPEHRAVRPEWPWWEATRLAAMNHFIKSGDVVVDVGAEEGDFPALFASWGADVILIEPNLKVWPNIKAIFQANDLGSHILGMTVGFASDQMADATDGGKAMYASWMPGYWPRCADGPVISNHGFRHLAQETDTTPQLTLDYIVDSFLPRRGGTTTMIANKRGVQHITMDVEGSELRVLRGAQQTIIDYRPYVWVSVHGNTMRVLYGDEPQDLTSLMWSLEYEEIFLSYDHETHMLYIPKEKCWVL